MISTFGILLIAIVIACLIAAVRSKSAMTIGVFLAFFIGLFLILFSGRPVRQDIAQRDMAADYEDQIGRAEEHQMASQADNRLATPLVRLPAATTSGSSWDKIDTTVFQAEVFPGIRSAATSLAQRITPMVTANAGTDKLSVKLTPKKSISDQCRSAFRNALQEQLPKGSLIIETASTPNESKEQNKTDQQTDAQPSGIRLTLEVEDPSYHPAAWDEKEECEAGQLTCTLFVEGQTMKQMSVVFDEKPWVDRWDEFVSKHPHNRYAVCTSSDLRSSANSASQSAVKNLKKIQLDAGTVYEQEIWVQANESLIVDRFAQKLTRPYGNVWREALLIELDGPEAESLKTTARTNHYRMALQNRSAENQTWWQCLMLVAVFAAVAIIGMVLNLITEGYFRGRIVGTVTVGAVIVFGTILVVMAT